MPELVEVETIKNALAPTIVGRCVENVWFEREETAAYPDAVEFCRVICGQRVESLSRRGKFLLVELSSGDTLMAHLRMTGQLVHVPADFDELPYIRAAFSLDDGSRLLFADLRRLGRFWLRRADEADIFSGAAALGPEPFDPCLDALYLWKVLGKSRRAIKTCLMDQHVIAGIGNIYSDEILYAAGIFPARPAYTLEVADWQVIAAQIPEVLSYFIEKCRISPDDYLAVRGQEYRNTPYLNVYARAGQACRRCGTELAHIRISGRSSVFCPHCQCSGHDNPPAEDVI